MTNDTTEDADAQESQVNPEVDDLGKGAPRRDNDAPDSDGRSGGDTARDGGPGRVPLVAGLLGFLVLALGGALFFVQQDRSDLQSQLDRTQEIADAASEFAVAVLTYDHADLEPSAAAVETLATESFAEEYRAGFEANLQSVIVEAAATSTAQVDEVFVNPTSGDTARVIVIATADVRSEAQSRVEVTSFIDLQMVRIDGRWLVDNMVSLGSDGTIVDQEGNPISPELPGQEDADPDASDTSTTTATTGG